MVKIYLSQVSASLQMFYLFLFLYYIKDLILRLSKSWF